MKLIYQAGPRKGVFVRLGDQVIMATRDATLFEITSIMEPRHAASTGRVFVMVVVDGKRVVGSEQGFFPSVFDLDWDERPDREPIRDPEPLGTGE